MGSIKKTNAMRILDRKKIEYKTLEYDTSDGKIDGVSVAEKVNLDPAEVYKTLVARGSSKNIYVFVIPVAEELDLKKAAVASCEKKIEMIHVKEIMGITGYIRGGCSPIGMKKEYKTFLDDSAMSLEYIHISGGKIGSQIIIKVKDLNLILDLKIMNIIR